MRRQESNTYQALINSNSIRQQLSLPNLFLIIATETPDQLTKIMEMADQTWSKEEQKFLLFAPPDNFSGLSLERSHTNLLFAEICEKWNTHFSSS